MSASVGEGHNAAAQALAEALRRAAPGCLVTEVAPMSDHAQAVTRRWYRLAVQVAPPLHQLWYWAVAHCRWVRWFYRAVAGARAGRALARQLAAARPDVTVSTYPLGTAGLAWLRRRGLTQVPVVAVLSDFAPHPFWVYPGVSRYAVLDEAGRDRMRTLAPGVPTEVCAPLVRPTFRPPSARETRSARERHGVPEDALSVLISCGSLGLGEVGPAVRAVLSAGPKVHAIVVCGRNQRLRSRLRRRFPDRRLRVLGWVDDMAELMAAVDVVVNNAGGVTAAEALARGRALVLFRPVAGHGRDCARAMAEAGLVETGTRRRWLTGLLNQWVAHPELVRAAQRRAARHAGRHRLAETASSILAEADPAMPQRAAS
ncbi:MAG: glycosyltransferase [Pseudonocardia sp.]|nr:glycosyltransferase [Pseudonocardia sp.]